MITADIAHKQITSDTAAYPRPICLAECDINVVRGYEKDVLKTLKAFSRTDLMEGKNDHPLHK